MKSIIESKKKNNARRNQVIIGVLLVAVMFVSVLGYGFQDNDDGEGKVVEYNGVKFFERNDFWFVQNYGGLDFLFKHNPEQIEKVSVTVNPIESYSNKPLYISSENQAASQEIVRNLGQVAQRVQFACFENDGCANQNYPIKNCSSNFIIIKETNETNIIQEQSCVFIKAPSQNLTQVADDFLFNVLGI